jgi:uncharacterized coiled-coil protein SlyX
MHDVEKIKMAQILTSFIDDLVVAICDHVGEVSDRCLERQLISSEVYGQILDSELTSTASVKARTLLLAVKDAVAINQTLFEVLMEILRNIVFPAEKVTPVAPFMREMEKQYQDLKCGVHSRSRKRKRTNSDPTEIELDEEPAAPLKVNKLIADNKPKTTFILTRNIIIEMFQTELVSAITISIGMLCDLFLERGLISDETYKILVDKTGINSKEDKAEILLQNIMESIESDDQCFDIFLTTLNETLPTAIGSKLVAKIIKESEMHTLLVVPSGNTNASSPCTCYQTSEVNDNSSDIHTKYQKATRRLAEAKREKKELEEKLASEIKENERLEKKISELRDEGHENTEQIEELNEMIAERNHEISHLRKKIKKKEEEVDILDSFLEMKMKRELFQKQGGLTLHTDVKKMEVAMQLCERLKVNQDWEKEFEEQRQTKIKVREDFIKLEREKNDLQETKNTLLRENDSLQSNIDFVEEMHSDCIRRSRENPCYCDIMGREYCPRRHSLLLEYRD